MRFELWILVCAVAAMAFSWLRRRRRGPIQIDESGIRVLRSPGSPLHLSWDEIDCFGVARVLEMEGGLYQGGSGRYVGVRLAPSSRKRGLKSSADNRTLSDYDVLLTPDRGVSVERFVLYLESQKNKFKPAIKPVAPSEGTQSPVAD